jgi:hypothetical protein
MSRVVCVGRVRRWSRGVLLAGVCLAATASWLGSNPSLQAQERKQVFVSVMGSNGVPILDLQPSDVKVFENQVSAPVASVEAVDWPMKLTVLVDNGARSTDYLAALRTGLRNFLNEIPDGVEVSILTLAPRPQWVLRPSTDLDKEMKSVALIGPDSGAGKFFDGLAEAAERIEKERGNYFPVILLVTSDVGGNDAPFDREWQLLKKRVNDYAITVHYVTLVTGSLSGRSVPGFMQTTIGIPLTDLTGGRYENINSASRLVTLLPEIGQQIAASHFRQTHQYRVTYEPPAEAPDSRLPRRLSVSVSSRGPVSVTPTTNGRLP